METYSNQNHHSILRTLIFIFLGVLVGITLWSFKDLLYSQSKNDQGVTQTEAFSLKLTSPKDNLTTADKNLVISGKTGTSSVVTVASSGQSIILSSSTSFLTKVVLTEGKNIITVTAFDPKTNQSQETTRIILYLNEDLTTL